MERIVASCYDSKQLARQLNVAPAGERGNPPEK